MTIIDSQPDHSVAIRLDFRKPFSATNRADFTLSPVGQSTIVNWRMTGKRAFMMKAVTSVIDCDKMVGAQFEDGLAAMKEIAEKR